MKHPKPGALDTESEWAFRDLQYTTRAYFDGEGIFPFWETIFAVLIAPSYYVFFSQNGSLVRIFTCVCGIVLSLAWWQIIKRNSLFSKVRGEHMLHIATQLQNRLGQDLGSWKHFDIWNQQTERIKCAIRSENGDTKTFKAKIREQLHAWHKYAIPSSLIRKLLPWFVLCTWLILLIVTWIYPPSISHQLSDMTRPAGTGSNVYPELANEQSRLHEMDARQSWMEDDGFDLVDYCDEE